MLHLDFGCGENVKTGFKGVDIRDLPGLSYHCPAWEIEKHVEPNSVSEIYSRNFLQYLSMPQAIRTLQAWQNILKPGGVTQIIVPDFSYWTKKIIEEDLSSPSPLDPQVPLLQTAIWQLWGHQRNGMDQDWDIAKSGYDFRLLSGMLLKMGFKTIFRVNEDKPWDLNIMAQKRGEKEEQEVLNDLKELERLKQQSPL